jgi:hypothetical protein
MFTGLGAIFTVQNEPIKSVSIDTSEIARSLVSLEDLERPKRTLTLINFIS